MRMMSQAASVVSVGIILAYYGVLFAEEDDTQIIRHFVDLSWKQGRLIYTERLPMLDWARWCKAGMQLGEFEICPPR